MNVKRAFSTAEEIETWNDTASTAANLPAPGQNALTGEPAPDKQQTTGITGITRDIDGNPILSAVIADSIMIARGLTTNLIRADLHTAEELAALALEYEAWAAGVPYAIGDVRRYGPTLWECVQAHTSQLGWEPPNVPALWMWAAPEGVIPEWVQPTGAHDAYNTGDLVTFNGSVFMSVIDANVWSPIDYPAGWQLIE